ncbi:uroporphyrinogen decarboxylase [Clostridia bacterium]|nr:uroporphyrinogen decarboxylase [Clostridia bacterium]
MNSRERFRAAIDHREPDRVPIDLGGDMHNGLAEVLYKNLLKYLGEDDEVRIYDHMQHLAIIKESVLERLHVDTRYIAANAGAGFERIVASDGSWADEWGIKRINVGLYDETIGNPLADITFEKLKNYKLPDPSDQARYAGLKEKAKSLYESTEYAILGSSAASFFYLTSELVGYQEYMEKLLLDTELIEALVDRMLEWQLEFFDHYLDEIGEYIDMVWIGDDWGTQIAPLMSPQLFRDIFMKRYKVFTKFIKSKADVKIALHSCGSIIWALDDLADAGIDVIHPMQGDAKGMDDPAALSEKYGNQFVVYSNLRNQTLLPRGTVDEVRKDVREKIQAWAPGGGYIMSCGHNIQADVPPENLLAVIDETLESGIYPIRK